ncbi:MAG: HD domain-containing phosphohydrolase [Eubacterium sp.]|nr:HD domain-containing phosphohydrolase [Eubacterium sp.]
MIDMIREQQLNIMLALAGACGICAFFVYMTHTFSPKKKQSLLLMELGSMILLIFERAASTFDGDPSVVGFWMVRICNFVVFFLTIGVIYLFNLYLEDIFSNDKEFFGVPDRLKVSKVLALVGCGMVVISQFIDLYYSFDASNTYQRAPGFLICYLFPLLVPVIQLSFILQEYKKLHKGVRISLILFPIVPIVAGCVQMIVFGILLTDMAIASMSIVLYVFALVDINSTVEDTRKKEIEILKKEGEEEFALFEQIVTAFVGAVDAKDVNRKGHAARVAGYARRLAEITGKTEEECQAAYFSALLHDVGKITLPDKIVKKKGKMTEKESQLFNEHVKRGQEILKNITEFPYLKDAAGYHHEWYDGTGYPGKYAGKEIPDMARLVALADAYDDMTSIREDREPFPQQVIREEIIKESGKHFDPTYAKAMLSMIDDDKDYQLREHHAQEVEGLEDELTCDAYRSKCSNGIPVTEEIGKISFRFEPKELAEGEFAAPSIIIFDAMDGRTHTRESSIKINHYMEYGEVWFDGHMICTRARNMKIKTKECAIEDDLYRVEVVRVRDHARVSMIGAGLQSEVIVALPDSSGGLFVSITGENCHISNIQNDPVGISLKEGDIPRIVDEVTYIDRMVGDVPNIQVDSYCSASTEGMSVSNGMEIVFHTMTLPGANLVWNCPFLVFFKSDDHRMYGPNYDELVLVRLDGESIETGGRARSTTETRRGEDFESWDKWKEYNKKGFECKVTLRRNNNRILMHTENAGIDVKSTIYTEDWTEDIRVAVTGDQCALTDIRFIA